MTFNPAERRGPHGQWVRDEAPDEQRRHILAEHLASRPIYSAASTFNKPKPQLQEGQSFTSSHTQLPPMPGWHLLGTWPRKADWGVGSWLLVNKGEAMLLEVPIGLSTSVVKQALDQSGARLKYVTASHGHYDHLDNESWKKLQEAFPTAQFIRPHKYQGDTKLDLGGEPVWMIKAPKHSPSDTVTAFRGTAMTGDIELNTLDSVNKEVDPATKAASMDYLKGFSDRTGYHVNTIVSAHLTDYRTNVHWPDLFNH